MGMTQQITRGDFIRAESDTGCVVVGQAMRDVPWSGHPVLDVVIAGEGGHNRTTVMINVNFWRVTVLHRDIMVRSES